ncbi:ATPase family AAA domain-containing protein 5-like, partial [Teleopsis dalmanni]|uniref:ATPase family AAA domain-containing protein 5-like n=1 Tax=Teleopsis dalmanni TaxID=139649 RepID=UPI0018CF0BE9
MFISAMKMTDSHTSIERSGSDYNTTTAQVDTVVSAINEPVQQINGTNGDCESESTIIPFVIKAPIANSKLILQNMEEVLNSVKKKHRQKHRRKREQKKLAQIEAAEAGLNRISNKPESTKVEKSERKHKKKPLQEKSALENDLIHTKTKNKYQKSPLKSVSNESILNHFSRTPKKSDNIESDVITNNKNETTSVNEIKKTNAFEVLMNARNKSIGSNSPGREVSEVCEVDAEKSAIKIKRKLLLEDWAEKKGASKRRADEEMREEYIEQEMKHRAKRLKKMLTNGHTPKSSPVSRLKENHKANDGLSQSSNAVTPTSTCKEKVKRKSRIRKRLESLESEESLNDIKKLDEETVEFLSKLNSPTKKRDSLLGYFSKKESPKDSIKKEVETTKTKEDKQLTPKINQKRNSKRRTPIEINSSNNIKQTNEKLSEEQCTTPSGRPKRSCADKARYDYDLDDINTEISNKANSSRSKATKCKDDRDDIVEVINLDESSSNETPTQTPKKLAPVFVRSIPKPPPDPEVLKARKEFLMSGLPEKIRLEWAKQKQQELIYEESIELFPKIAHVQQFDANDLSLVQYKAFEIKFRADTDNDSIKNSNRKSKSKSRSSIGNLTSCTIQDFRTISKCNINDAMRNVKLQSLPVLQNKIKIVKMWKSKFLNFPTYKCYNQLREKYRYFSAIDSAQNTEQVTESFVVTRRTTRTTETKNNFDDSTEYKPPSAAPNGELLFNEKYRPMLFEQVLVNLTPITQLRDFLSNWSDSNSSSVRSSQALDDSVDFVNDSNSSAYGVCNTMVLLGPISSGKTSAVFALANEMNFNVLEINAGMKRTGKKLIQELQEATQSHQIRKEASAGHIKSKQKLLKMSLKKQNSQTF